MNRVRIYRPDDVTLNDAALRTLLSEAECAEAGPSDEADSLLIVLTPDLVDGPELEDALKAAVKASLCVVAIWPRGATVGVTPGAINKYASDIIIWDPARLQDTLGDDCDPHYDDPDGKPRREPVTPRNC